MVSTDKNFFVFKISIKLDKGEVQKKNEISMLG